MTPAQIIVLATPAFLALIALEYAVGVARGRDTYRLHDAISSIGLGMINQLAAVLTTAFTVGIYALAYGHVALLDLRADDWRVWIAGLVLYDFLYYWHHRAGHRVGLYWAAHVVHHQSEDYNLSTALRQTGTGWLAGWVFYLPMAVLGFPPAVFAAVALIDLLYQFWVHTQQVGRLGWFDRVFCSPSNHRVHHAVNDRYVDRNYGGILILWDRLFGTFQEERDDDPPVYGTRSPLRSFDPLRANFEVYATLARDAWHARSWVDKARLWFMPPGWRPADVAARFPRRAFDLREVRRFDPSMTPAARIAASAGFVALLVATALWLWHAHELGTTVQLAGAGAIVAGLVAVGALCERGTRPKHRVPRDDRQRFAA